jgi:two-component system chemotaxis response regulator CheB
MKKIKVLIVDDSPVFRAILTQLIESADDLEVVGAAEDPYKARDLIKQLNPDVVTLDIEMPKMNGVQFLKNLMRLRPMPVIMISTLTTHGAEATLMALELGAIDYFPKPTVEESDQLTKQGELINEKIRVAASANVLSQQTLVPETKPLTKATSTASPISTKAELIAIGASTGGTEALNSLLSQFPDELPPIVITQHISAQFSASLARRLDNNSAVSVHEVSDKRTELQHGCAYLAPGDKHIILRRKGSKLYVELDDGPLVSRHKPSVDVMFDSIVNTVGAKCVAALLTGMGQDGAEGLLNLKNKGAATIAQDEATSVVWGMPRVAVELGAAVHVTALPKIPKKIFDCLKLIN